MQAAVFTEYGPPEVLRLGEVEKPTPGDREILVRIHAAPVTFGDLAGRKFGHISPRDFHMPFLFWLLARLDLGFSRPKKQILGGAFAGEVAAAGAGVTRFAEGDPVFGYVGSGFGAYAEYRCVPEDGVVAPKPVNMSSDEAAALPYGALVALNLLRKVELQPGQQVLIVGASGGIGSAALQLARHSGAEVTGVCGPRRREYVRTLGAARVIDYTQEDFTAGDEAYDVIFDVLGKSSFARARRVLKPDGRYLLASFKLKQLLQMLRTSRGGGQRVICALAMEKPEDLEVVRELAEAGVLRAVIDRRFPLAEAAAAHRYVEAGQQRGSVVITPVQVRS